MTLQPGDVTLKVHHEQLSRIADDLRQHYYHESGEEIPEWILIDALSMWLEHRFEAITEDLSSVLSTPARSEAQEFRKFLEESMRSVRAIESPVEPTVEDAVYTGNRAFSIEKLAAMTAYIARFGRDIYKTKLNKLLFYSDFIHYYINGSSISGAKYLHLPYGPVPDRYESMVQNLALTGTLKILKGQGYELLTATADDLTDRLSNSERSTIDWVLDNLGKLSASEISEYSHQEKAYRFTKPGENIAYEYAKFFRKLPPTREH